MQHRGPQPMVVATDLTGSWRIVSADERPFEDKRLTCLGIGSTGQIVIEDADS